MMIQKYILIDRFVDTMFWLYSLCHGSLLFERQSLQKLSTSKEVRQLHQELSLNMDTKIRGLSDSITESIVKTVSQQLAIGQIDVSSTSEQKTNSELRAVQTGGRAYPTTLG
jgi:hypothetical protein